MKTAIIIFLCLINYLAKSQTTIFEDSKIDSTYLTEFAVRYRIAPALEKKLYQFYTENNFELAWFADTEPVPHASLLINVVNNRNDHGITTTPIMDGYNLSDTLSYLEEADLKSTNYYLKKQKSFDVMLTASYFKHIPALWSGVIDPYSKQDIEWYLKKNTFSYTHVLDSILNDTSSQNPFLDYRNFHNGYFRLKGQLTKYHSIKENGGWPLITTNKLARGDTGKWVMTLAARLKISGDLKTNLNAPRFNSQLEKAVKRFQERHGLKRDGIVGEQTLRELNTSVDDRIRQLIVNLERWRWVPPLTQQEYIYVNIPEYQLYVFNGNRVNLQMPVIVGKPASHTVIFNDVLEYVVVNPYWNIPYSIAVEEMLPKRKKDSTYFKDRNIEVGTQGDYDSIVAESSIDWQNLSPDNFPYTLRQKPGPFNPLGLIKFIFPNRFSIYLHDTPSRNLFAERNRNFSHGCIRVSKPYVLADYILKNQDNFLPEKGTKISALKEKNLWIKIDHPLPVYILYFTAWVNGDGHIHYRNDIYGHDQKLIEHMFTDL